MATIIQLQTRYKKKIMPLLEPGFEEELFLASMENLKVIGPLCFNNFAYSLRELMRHVLHRLAPASEVKKCAWFNPDPTSKDGITRTHRATFAIQGGLSKPFLSKVLLIDVPPIVRQLVSSIEVLNAHTHIEFSTFNIPRREVIRLAEECMNAASEFSQLIIICRERVVSGVRTHVDSHLLERAISDTIDEIDQLATHHLIEIPHVEEIEITSIGSCEIELVVHGTIAVTLQYGSDSDMDNDQGVEIDDAFPFNANLTIQMVRPLGKVATVESFQVDTQSFYE